MILPRSDFYPYTIQRVNTDKSNGPGTLSNDHLHDHLHPRKENVHVFAKTLKDVALGRLHVSPINIAKEPPSLNMLDTFCQLHYKAELLHTQDT